MWCRGTVPQAWDQDGDLTSPPTPPPAPDALAPAGEGEEGCHAPRRPCQVAGPPVWTWVGRKGLWRPPCQGAASPGTGGGSGQDPGPRVRSEAAEGPAGPSRSGQLSPHGLEAPPPSSASPGLHSLGLHPLGLHSLGLHPLGLLRASTPLGLYSLGLHSYGPPLPQTSTPGPPLSGPPLPWASTPMGCGKAPGSVRRPFNKCPCFSASRASLC